MKKSFFTICTFLLALNVNANLDVNDVAVSYSNGSFFSKRHCSASFIRNNSKRYFVSAAHCFPKAPNENIKTYIYNSNSFDKISNSKVKVNLKKGYYFKRNGDTVFQEIPTSQDIKTKELELSTSRPQKGDYISVMGYPSIKGYLVATKLECEFIGSAVYNTPLVPTSVGRIAKCQTDLKSIAGISGAPVLDESGDILGTVSAEMQPSSDIVFEDDRFIYIVYNEISNELLENRRIVRADYDFVMFNPEGFNYIEGRRIYSRNNE